MMLPLCALLLLALPASLMGQSACPADITLPAGPPTEATVRDYAWKLFSAINQPAPSSNDGLTFWESWYSRSEAFSKTEPNCSQRTRRRKVEPVATAPAAVDFWDRLFHHSIQPRQRIGGATGDIGYNPAAFRSIRLGKFFDTEALDTLRKNLPAGTAVAQRTIHLDDKSIIVKAAWYRIPAPCGKIPYWRASSHSEDEIEGVRQDWKDQQLVVTDKDHSCEAYDSSDPSVPISQVHAFRIPDSDLQLYKDVRPYVPTVKKDDSVALLGLHVAARLGLDQWFWATFWWDPDPNFGDYGAGRPTDLPPGFDHYLMRATLTMKEPIFNPFIETNPKVNCVRCHALAAIPLPPPQPKNSSPRLDDPKLFGNALRTDFILSICHNSMGDTICPQFSGSYNPFAHLFRLNTGGR